MESALEMETEKRVYFVPTVKMLFFSRKDILCMSNEENDNEFDAGDLAGDF